jgi:hypothetical protein
MMNLKQQEKKKQKQSKTSRWKEKINTGTKNNEIKTKRTIQRINETKSWFFEKINKIDKPLAIMTNREWRRPRF